MKESDLVKDLVSDYLKENQSDGFMSSYEVNMIEESPEMKIIREVMEEPNDTMNFDVKIQYVKPISYIKINLMIENDKYT